MTLEEVKQTVRNIPDFPIPGIQFKDLTTAFLNPDALRTMKEAMVALYKNKGIPYNLLRYFLLFLLK